MTELGLGALTDILLHLVPVTLVIADFLTVYTDRHDPSQCSDLIKGLLESPAFFIKSVSRAFAFGDVVCVEIDITSSNNRSKDK